MTSETPDKTGQTPGFLRLPTEIRLQIYPQLFDSNIRECPEFLNDLPPMPPIKHPAVLFSQPIIQVCHLVRREIIMDVFGKLRLYVNRSKEQLLEDDQEYCDPLLPDELDEIEFIDAHVLKCFRGLVLQSYDEACDRENPNDCGCYPAADQIIVTFDDGVAQVEMRKFHSRACAGKISYDQERMALVQCFTTEVERVGGVTKAGLTNLIKALDNIEERLTTKRLNDGLADFW